MATAELRTRWQRTANRCYVHGDSTEASRFSLCPSSSLSYSSSSESDRSPENASKEPHDIIPDYLSPYPNSDVPINRRWWLNQDPNLARPKDFMHAHQHSLEAELEILRSEFVNNEHQLKEGFGGEARIESYTNHYLSSSRIESGQETKLRGLKAIACRDPQKIGSGKDAKDFWFLDDDLMDLDSLNSLVSEESKKLVSDFEYHCNKTEPWWRSASKDDLASLVAQKSLGHIENCDLPRPQAKNYRKQPSACSKSLDHNDILAPSIDRMADTGLSNLDSSLESPNSGCSPDDSGQTFSSNSGHSTASVDKLNAETSSGSDQSKDQLMRALCLSQKRAREAEKAAEQAYTEKEHIITLLFRQASQLFAYKQWLRLLQLENICLQLKNKNQPICDLLPSVLPWTPCKGKEVKKSQHRAGRKRHSKPGHDISKCAVAFALGLGLASAGLLLGWTMGWLFPTG